MAPSYFQEQIVTKVPQGLLYVSCEMYLEEYVGRVISNEGLSMSKVKIQSVLNFEKPRNLHALRSLLGLENYFRGFVNS